MPQVGPLGPYQKKNEMNILGIIIIALFVLYGSIILCLLIFPPQMEEAGEETSELVSGEGATAAIINNVIIPQLRTFFILTLISFGILDTVFTVMLLKGNPRKEHEMLVMPFFILYLINRIASGFIITFLTSSALLGNDPRGSLNSLYLTLFVCSIFSIVIIILLHMKIFTPEKKKAVKILVARPE